MSVLDWFIPEKKEQIGEGYEILSFIDKGEEGSQKVYRKGSDNYFAIGLNRYCALGEMIELVEDGTVTIHSVKRLSDKRVFTLESRNYAIKNDFTFGKMVNEIRLNKENDIVVIYEGMENIPIVIQDKKASKWQTVNTSTSENVEALHYGYSKDYDQVMGKNKKDYTIISFYNPYNSGRWNLMLNGEYSEDSNAFSFSLETMIGLVKKGSLQIDSVKRILDREVFSVNDNEKYIGKITKISIGDDGIVYLFSAEENWTKLNFAEKQTVLKEQSVVLLTTNEGVKVFNPENIIYILHKDFSKGKCKAGAISKNQNNIFFWSEESLNDYIIQNKPVPVTAIELAKAISFTSDQLNQLVDFFKAKN